MKFTRIKLEIEERIATITLSEPEKLNAMSLQMRTECVHALRELEQGGDADCVIITGDGPKAFSAGADINELAARTLPGELSTNAQLRRDLPRLIETMRLPTIGAINGFCLGAGLELALAFTMRVAGESAKIGLPEINLGVIPGSGGTQRLARLVGLGRAMELVTLGESISAQEAQQIGLVNRVCPDAELMETARAICRKWQRKGPISLMAARDAVLKSADVDLQTGMDYENKLFALCIASGERDEGVNAFLQKRSAKFRN